MELNEEVIRQNQVIKELVNVEPLTGLPSHRLAEDRLNIAVSQANRHNTSVGLLFLDIDDLKKINDTYGHGIGDMELQAAAHRLLARVREGDTVSRIGGDEFLFILSQIEHPKRELPEIANRIRKLITEEIVFANGSLPTTVSIGGSCYPDDGSSMEELRNKADEMMYLVKRSGKNSFKLSQGVMKHKPEHK